MDGGVGVGGGSQCAIPRRHAPLEQLVRQGSFRGFPNLSRQNSPFKRQLSLRLNELPSTLQRRDGGQAQGPGEGLLGGGGNLIFRGEGGGGIIWPYVCCVLSPCPPLFL